MRESRRIDKLISGEITPIDQAEFALVKAYTRAKHGETLMKIVIDMSNEMVYYGVDEYRMFTVGYSIGQKDYLDKTNGLDLSKLKKNKDEQSH